MDRGAIASWSGAGANGTLTTDSGALINVPCSYASRYELAAEPPGSNPEELLAAALAGCFTMTLAEMLEAADHPPHSIRTEARVILVKPQGHWTIPSIRLHCTAFIPGIEESEFRAIAHLARARSPIARSSRAEITLTVTLETARERERTTVERRASSVGERT